MNKKTLAILFFLLMLISLFSAGAMAAGNEYSSSVEIAIPGGYTLQAVKYTHRCGNAGVMKELVVPKFERKDHTLQLEIDIYIKCEACRSYMHYVPDGLTITVIDDCKQAADTPFSIDGGNMGGQIDFILTSPAVGGNHVPVQKYDASGHWDGCSKCSLQLNKTVHSLIRKYDVSGHWDDCSACDYISSTTAHSPVVKFDENGHWDDCSACDYVSASASHSPVIKFDQNGHWDGCSKCDLQLNKTEHNSVQKFDADNHWIGCSDCEHQQGITPHSPVVEFDENGHWDDCSACDYVSSTIPHSTVVEFDTENHWDDCSDCDYRQNITPHTMQASGTQHFCSGCAYTVYVAPATGDSRNLALWIGLMAASIAGAALFVRRSRKEC